MQGWCQTTSQTLPGEYMGSWVSGSAEAHTVQITIAHTGTWSISIVGLRECAVAISLFRSSRRLASPFETAPWSSNRGV